MEGEVYLTKEGYKELEEKLFYLKSEARVDVANKIKVARSFGDISENSEYDAAREEEAQLEQQINEIENTLRVAKIISKSKVDTTKVNVGCVVELYDVEFKEDLKFKVMGSFESDPSNGMISNESPIGKALMGKEVGDEVVVTLANGAQSKYKVLSIQY